MIKKLELYNKIMEQVAIVVKRALDETLTTYPWDRVTNYISSILKDLNIIISKETPTQLQPGYIPSMFLHDEGFDDGNIDIIGITIDDITLDDDLFKKCKNTMQTLGYTYLKKYRSEENLKKIILRFTPNKLNSIDFDSNIFTITQYLYHICPHYVTEKIKELGFVPK